MRVLVTGAGGTLGREVSPRLVDAGFEVRATSRRPRTGSGVRWVTADLATGEGIASAVTDVDAVLHLASSPTRQTQRIDVLGTRRLVTTAADAGVQHLVYVSIVGVDRVPYSYYRHKLAAEQIIAAGKVPWTVLRATQFFPFIDELLRLSSKFGPVIGDRAVLAQPVDPGEVADKLVELLRSGARGDIVEYGGPEVQRFDEAVRAWRQARGFRRPLLPIRFPGRLGRELRAGGLVTDARPAGRRTWADYLSDTYGRTAAR
ncbi:SDR family oxidoreductase [Micromonospora sp. NPDC000442]|uniref:SDR family oxidoreductase n=1 Tax=Micromonospora sp. NPDC000442 TaxID=3364217 RepID=UPI003674CB65